MIYSWSVKASCNLHLEILFVTVNVDIEIDFNVFNLYELGGNNHS